MGCCRTLGKTSGMLGCVLLIMPALSGCAILNGFLDPTKVGAFPLEYKESGIRRILTPRDTPPGPPNATEPSPEDLVPSYDDYQIAPGDIVAATIQDLFQTGMPYQAAMAVSPSGVLRLPQVGSIKAVGLTEVELEEEIKARYRDAEILPDPDVQVFLQTRRRRTFVVRGLVGQAGTYPIGDPDTRILDAIGMFRDLGSSAQKLYIIRREQDISGTTAADPFAAERPPDELVIEPPEDDEDFEVDFFTSGRAVLQAQPPVQKQPRDKADLEAIIAPGPTTRDTKAGGASVQTEPSFPPLIFDPHTGELIESALPPPTEAEPAAPFVEPVEDISEEPFDWDDVPELELEQRVIEINIRGLLAGDPRYNVVIRDRDVINVPIDNGVFYLMGEVNRPGVYAFNGRDISIKQALAMSGGFTPLAWPQRCEIIRHEPGTDKQLTIPVNLDAIFAGLEDDLFLRDDDIINVGTHFVSPFLFVIRNSFRFTYGFGFVYDRNFADKDAYGAQQNPQSRADQQAARQGLLF
ncbi:MAG: polysaccharide biosynthesis/export family protein [Planctomycetota bacterium]